MLGEVQHPHISLLGRIGLHVAQGEEFAEGNLRTIFAEIARHRFFQLANGDGRAPQPEARTCRGLKIMGNEALRLDALDGCGCAGQ